MCWRSRCTTSCEAAATYGSRRSRFAEGGSKIEKSPPVRLAAILFDLPLAKQRRPPLKKTEELIVTPCGSRCVSACQPIVSSSRQMVEVLRTHRKTTQLRHCSASAAKRASRVIRDIAWDATMSTRDRDSPRRGGANRTRLRSLSVILLPHPTTTPAPSPSQPATAYLKSARGTLPTSKDRNDPSRALWLGSLCTLLQQSGRNDARRRILALFFSCPALSGASQTDPSRNQHRHFFQ